jgi:hypothetical protein
MSLSHEARKLLPLWTRAKQAQWERIASSSEGGGPAMPGLQLVRSGEKRSTFMLVCSAIPGPDADGDGEPGFYEGIVYGRLPQVVNEVKRGHAGQRISVPVPEHRKPLTKRGVDLKDQEIDAVLACWKAGRSALDLPFVEAVWGRDGQMVTR